MTEKRFFTKINKRGKLVIIDKDCNTELEDMYCACEVLNRLDLKRRTFIEENEQLRRYVYHCPQICNIILAYLRKCESEDVKAVNDAMNDDKYFDDDIDTLRSWE